MIKQTELFESTDIKSCSYLLSRGVSIVKIITENPQKIIFCFPDTDEVKQFLKEYWTNKGSANPRLLFENFDYLKGLVHRNYQI